MAHSSKKVFVGLSGGVDSSVSAALLKRAGYDVVGVFIKVWSPEWLPCTWPEERRDAMRVCAALDIPFVTLDLANEYKHGVAEYMIEEYRRGRTPNPDVMCNKEIKFGAFYDWAMKSGADYVATGHYARTEKVDSSKLEAGNSLPATTNYLLTGTDDAKDQSYFLWNLKQEQLPHILFPVGDKKKDGVRKLAKKFKIPVADKKDSQGICFLGALDMKEFLSHYIQDRPGDVLDIQGNVLGEHRGAFFYTIGEAFPLGGSHSKLFVKEKDVEGNILVVSSERPEEAADRQETSLTRVNWISGEPDLSKKYLARVRYRQELQRLRVVSFELRERTARIKFEDPQILNPGQSVVIYEGERCLGGGVLG